MASINLLIPSTEKQSKTLSSRTVEIKRIIEALLFSSSDPLSIDKIRDILEQTFPVSPKELKQVISDLQNEYELRQSAIQIEEIGGGYILRTLSELGPYIEQLCASKRAEKLSKASMEVLAIVAYRAPVTRAEIEEIRGVDSSGTLASLVERGLVESKGRKESPGRPVQWGPSKLFLKHFGLKSIDEFIDYVAQTQIDH